jgi:hypothetical protein
MPSTRRCIVAQNKQTDQRKPQQDQGGQRQKSQDDDFDRKAKDKSGMSDEDMEEGDDSEDEEQ